jgi:hypothetical protein
MPFGDWAVLLAALVVLVVAGGWLATASATMASASSGDSTAVSANLSTDNGRGRNAAAQPESPAADSPSPSLGATPQPSRVPPGDNDSDPDDWSGTPWVIAAIVAFLVVIAGITYTLFRGGRLTWRRQNR